MSPRPERLRLVEPSRVAHAVIPAAPPPEALAAVDAAWERGRRLAAAGRQLHFEADGGRVTVEVRGLDGTRIRGLTPSQALDVMAGVMRA